jgi:Cu-processing system permease protein
MAGLALVLAFLGSAPTGHVGVPPLAVTVVSLTSLGVFLVPLIALVLSHDALVSEVERGTMLLLLTYPVRRWQIVMGKFIGHSVLLGMAIIVGYGAAGILIMAATSTWNWGQILPFLLLIASTTALGMVFLALGYLISALVREHATAAGIAVGLWLLSALLFDMGLLGILAVSGGKGISPSLFGVILLLDPTDVFRLVNLTMTETVRHHSGMAGVSAAASVSGWALGVASAAWVACPLACSITVFSRRPL